MGRFVTCIELPLLSGKFFCMAHWRNIHVICLGIRLPYAKKVLRYQNGRPACSSDASIPNWRMPNLFHFLRTVTTNCLEFYCMLLILSCFMYCTEESHFTSFCCVWQWVDTIVPISKTRVECWRPLNLYHESSWRHFLHRQVDSSLEEILCLLNIRLQIIFWRCDKLYKCCVQDIAKPIWQQESNIT